MLKTLSITTDIQPDRELHIVLPHDTPLGRAEVVVIVSSVTPQVEPTFGDLLASEFFGMWRDREDITDSVAFARQLRTNAWSRSQ